MAAAAWSTLVTRSTSSGRMSSVVRWASAASTSSCVPRTISATRSASTRAACSRSNASRSRWRRRRSLTSRMNADRVASPPALHAVERLLGREGGAVLAPQLRLHLHDLQRFGALHQESSLRVVLGTALVGEDQVSQRAADRLSGGPAEEPLGGGVPGRHESCPAVDRYERVGRGVEQEAGPGLALAQLERPRLRLGGLAAQPAEEARHQETGHRGRADGKGPPQHGPVLDREHHRVAHADPAELHQRRAHREEVEGEERGPGVEQRVEQRHPDGEVGQRDHHGPHGHEHVEVPLAQPCRVQVQERGYGQGGDHERQYGLLVHLGRVRHHQREHAHRRAGPEQVGQ